MSTKSDSGAGGARPVSSVLRCEVVSSNNKRNWRSESHLELQAGSHKPYKALSLNTLLKVRPLLSDKTTKQTTNILSRSWAWAGRA